MKTLYESILSSTKSGRAVEAEKVLKWFKSTRCYIMNFNFSEPDFLDAKPSKNNSWEIELKITDNSRLLEYWNFDKQDSGGSGILPYRISAIVINGKPVNINYQRLKFKDSDDYAQEVGSFITFCGCTIDKVDGTPKNCDEINFLFAHSLGGGEGNTVKEIKNIKVDKFLLNMWGDDGLWCRLDKIKGITVKQEMQICEGMLGGFAFEKGNKRFLKDAGELFTTFFKNNNVKPENCIFIPSKWSNSKFKKGKIKYNEKTDTWTFIGINEYTKL
jgi:hypothetical protein